MIDIPVIDISPENQNAANQLLNAATDNGFAFIKNNDATGLSEADIRGMFDLSADFFASPTSIKEECSINSSKSGKNRGWLGMHGETLDPGNQKKGDFKEAFNFVPHNPPQPLSGPLSSQRDTLLSFQSKCHALCVRILRLFASALSIDPSWFDERHDMSKGDTGSVLRLLYYPSLETLKDKAKRTLPNDAKLDEVFQEFTEGEDVRAGAHSDYGSVTLLFQQLGQPGLEILTREGKWASVPVNPGEGRTPLPILLNIGDLLSYWTNGLLKSTVHRVIFPSSLSAAEQSRDRYSMAYFCHPLDSALLQPVPSDLVRAMSGSKEARREIAKIRALGGRNGEDQEGGGEVITARDHLNARLGATYGIKT
ncbi:Non-heme dioxygenase in morphine synthesis N-terminal-containing protein 6 [Elsinoe fawcettii]|nr:Non-heme dioxygenase in morphine synthesis N-terminal-containing protein 6 [Elsinoe fawcettii]